MAKNTDADVLEITQIRSDIGAQQAQRRTLRALGLRRIRHTVNHPDRPEIRGMLAKVAHLVEVRPAEGERQRAGGRGSEKQDTQAAKPAKTSTKKSSQRPKKKNDEEET